ncbi:MAG: hypothetical protein SFV15_25170 [Polyangiaceae bacterium]|nr:hypothetical protein [Polyangiaceae bacterium]
MGTSGEAKAEVQTWVSGYHHGVPSFPLERFSSTCVSQSQFVAKVVARLRTAVPPRGLSPHYLVSIQGPTLEGQIVGVVDIFFKDGQVVRRQVNSNSCASVSDALAIVVALSLEAGEDVQGIPLVLIRPARLESAPTFSVGGGASGIATNVLHHRSALLGLAGQVQVRFATTLADPIVSVGFYRFDDVLIASPIKDLHLDLTFARLTVWPAAIPLTETLEFRPGLFTELGQISALESQEPDSWWAGGADLSLGWVGPWVTLSGSVGAVLPLKTQTFSARGTGQQIHAIKGLGVFTQLGASVWIL